MCIVLCVIYLLSLELQKVDLCFMFVSFNVMVMHVPNR